MRFYFVGSHCVLFLVVVSSCASVGKLLFEDGETEVLRITGVTVISLRNVPGDEDRLGEFVKLLSSGIFYFAVSVSHSPSQTSVAPFDLTLCAQRAALGTPTDNRFFWYGYYSIIKSVYLLTYLQLLEGHNAIFGLVIITEKFSMWKLGKHKCGFQLEESVG